MRLLGGAVLVAAVGVVLTGCGSQAAQPTTTPTVTVAPSSAVPSAVPSTPVPDPTATASAPTEAASGPAASAAADPGRPADQCTDLGVTVSVADGGGGAGSEYYNVLFTNTGGEPCSLRGTPGVSVVGGGSGAQLGAPADRVQTGVKTIRLRSGETAAAPLRIVDIGTDGGPLEGCTVRHGDGYRVYPPHSTRAFFVQDPDAVACAKGPSFMTASPVIRFTD